MKIVKGADNIIRYPGPINGADNSSINDDDYANVLSTFRVFKEREEHTLGQAKTRSRNALAAAAVTLEIPYFEQQIYYTGDTIVVAQENGRLHSSAITVVRGTDKDTPATNFDTITLSVGVVSSVAVGAEVFMSAKGTTGVNWHVEKKDLPFGTDDRFRIRMGSGVVEQKTIVGGESDVRVWEDGERASDQGVISMVEVNAAVSVATETGASAPLRSEIFLASGDPVAMSIYPASPGPYPVGSDAWGYAGTLIAADTASMGAGLRLQIEITFDGDTVGGGLLDKKIIRATVVE